MKKLYYISTNMTPIINKRQNDKVLYAKSRNIHDMYIYIYVYIHYIIVCIHADIFGIVFTYSPTALKEATTPAAITTRTVAQDVVTTGKNRLLS